MISLKIKEVLEATRGQKSNGRLVIGDLEASLSSIVIDSRQAGPDTMFIAIIGENTDGHKYIKSAYDLGCRTFMVCQELDILDQLDGSSIVCVDNTELAMGQLAKYYKNKFDIPVVGITGSVGKTTTRDMVYAVVSNKFRSLKNEKNLNNQFGVPLTIFNLDSSYECAVIEMGMSGFGEIDYLADIVRPDIAVISNIGTSHIEHLGSQEGIFKAKMEISDYFSEDSCLIVNGDDEYLSKLRAEKDAISYSLCSFGKDWKNTIVLKSIENLDNKTNFVVKLEDKEEEFSIPTVGEHNVYNAMSAILVGLRLGMNIDEIRQGLMNFVATGDRQNIINTGKYLVINDVYNASPDSMIASLKVLALNKDRRKVAILGDCLEMGDYEEEGHRRVGLQSVRRSDVIITQGKAARFIGIEAQEHGFDLSNIYHFDTKEELIEDLKNILEDQDAILVKASRGMAFEDIVNYLKEAK